MVSATVAEGSGASSADPSDNASPRRIGQMQGTPEVLELGKDAVGGGCLLLSPGVVLTFAIRGSPYRRTVTSALASFECSDDVGERLTDAK